MELLVEFTDHLIEQGMETKEAIIEAGRIRMTPWNSYCISYHLRINSIGSWFKYCFVTMFTELNPHIFFGWRQCSFLGAIKLDDDFWTWLCHFLNLNFGTCYVSNFGKYKGQSQ